VVDQALEERYLDLIDHNRGRLARLCRAWTRTAPDFEDLRSEILLQLWRSLPSFDGRASENTWLYQVALNVAFQFGRTAQRQRRRLERLEREPKTESREADQPARLEADERIERLTRALATLAPGDRALITLALEELSYAQIAEVTGLSESHVGVKLHRIKKHLAQRLVEEEASHGRG
jgi:RNA polymerase sigma-70 factor (ECF subfamily)